MFEFFNPEQMEKFIERRVSLRRMVSGLSVHHPRTLALRIVYNAFVIGNPANFQAYKELESYDEAI